MSVDMKAVKAQKDHVSGLSRDGVERSLKNLEGCTVYQGHARFVGPRTVQVGAEILEAEKIFINVGGRALAPPIPGLDEVGYYGKAAGVAESGNHGWALRHEFRRECRQAVCLAVGIADIKSDVAPFHIAQRMHIGAQRLSEGSAGLLRKYKKDAEDRARLLYAGH